MHRKIAQTGAEKSLVIFTCTGAGTERGLSLQTSLRVVCMGTPIAAEYGLVIVKAASCSSLTDDIPRR